MVSWLIYGIVSFLVQALALQLAVGSVSDSRDNTYGTALTLAALFTVLGVLLLWLPIVGWFIYAAIWVVVISGTYGIGVLRSLLVALMQTLIHALLRWGLSKFGLM